MTALKFVAIIAVVCLVFSASSATAFADSTPTPDVTPYPWYTSPPIQPIHVEGAFSAYYLKFNHSTTWTQHSDINSSGQVISYTGRGVTDFISILPSLDKMIAVFSTQAQKFQIIRNIAFYDSDKNFISLTTGDSQFTSSDFPSDASYFRLSVNSGGSPSALATVFRVLISPEFHSYTWDQASSQIVFDTNFWRDYIYSHPYIISGSTCAVSLPIGSYPVDELFLDFQFSESFIPCDLVSCSLFTQVKDGLYNNDFYPVDYNNRDDHTQVSYALFNPYYFDSDGLKVFCSRNASTQRNNPFTPSVRIEEGMFSGFTFVVPLNKPDGLTSNSVVFVQLSDLTINYNDVVVDSIDSLSEMDRISSQLQLPTPDTGVIFDNLNITVQQMQNTDFYNVDWFGPTGGILMTMLVTVFTFAALGYILFGKKG